MHNYLLNSKKSSNFACFFRRVEVIPREYYGIAHIVPLAIALD